MLMLTKLRQQKGMSKQQLATAVSCTRACIVFYEQQKMYPSLPRARRLALALGASIEELFTECTDPEEDHDEDTVCATVPMGP